MIVLPTNTKATRRTGRLLIGLGVLVGSLLSASTASAQTLTILGSFNGSNGANPYAGLIADANGNLFGTAASGGDFRYGTVFELAKTSTGYVATPTTLISFTGNRSLNGSIGAYPYAGLLADANGNLFGTTVFGGANVSGTIFELAKTATGYAAAANTLVSFNDSNGGHPYAPLIADANGNLFGTAGDGGGFGYGTVFELAKTATGYAIAPTTLVSFNGSNGFAPNAGLLADANGNLFGTTPNGGDLGAGNVFELAKTATGYAATPTTLVSFNGGNGAYPSAGLIADANGNLFGTTQIGGDFGGGTVFEIAATATGYAAASTTLVSFNSSGSNGAYPYAGLIADANGNLFGTTYAGGVSGLGTVFELAKTATGYAAAPTTVVSFNVSNGSSTAGLIADANGNLFGTTGNGGTSGLGTVFEIAGSGFVPPLKFAGMPGSARCHGVSISNLATAYGGLNYAAAALGYQSVAALQSAVKTYCGM